MKNYRNLTKLSSAVVLLFVAFLSVTAAHAVPIYFVNTSNKLFLVDSAQSFEVIHSVNISGVQANEAVLAIDFRPSTRELYALGSSSRLYRVNTQSGLATQVGTQSFTPTLDGNSFGFDFDPVLDRIRVVSNKNQNLMVHPETGEAVVLTATAYASGDKGTGRPETTALAYTNKTAADSNTLYGFDFQQGGALVKIDAQGSGQVNTLGQISGRGPSDPLTDKLAGFDISDTGVPYLAYSYYDRDAGPTHGFFTIDLATRKATSIGYIGSNEVVRGLAVNPSGLASPEPNPVPPGTPILLRQSGSPRAIALDSVTLLRDPIPTETRFNFSGDNRTRLMIFAANIQLQPGEDASIFTAEITDVGGNSFPVVVEFAGKVPNFEDLTQINIRLRDLLPWSGLSGLDYFWISITTRGKQSNKALIILADSR